MDKLLAMKMLVEAVDAQGFSAAARKLGLATSSVTRLVDALEGELGATLLNRSTRQITLTEAGAVYYQKARKILDEVADADAEVADRGEQPVGQLRVCVPVEFGRRKIAPYLGRLLARFPAMSLDLTLSDTIDDLLGGRFDVAVRLGNATTSDDVVCRHLANFERWVVASPGYLSTHGEPQTPQDLLAHECLRFSYSSGRQVWHLRHVANDVQDAGIEVKGRLKCGNADVLRECCISGAGIALLADWLVRSDVDSGRLTRLLPAWQATPDLATNGISALYLPNHRGSKRVAAFIGFLEEILNG